MDVAKEMADKADAPIINITIQKGAEKIAGVDVDVIEIAVPALANMKADSNDNLDKLAKAIGDDSVKDRKFRTFLAAPDKNTVVLTFGGGTAFCAQAIKASAGKGPIAMEAGTKAALKHLPANPTVIALFNATNLVEAVKTGEVTIREEDVGTLNIADYVPDVEPNQNMSYVDLLVVAMKKEKLSYKLYTNLAAIAQRKDLRDIFLKLAQEEAEHKLRFEFEYDLETFGAKRKE